MSVNTGRVRQLEWRGRTYSTAFIKEPLLSVASIGFDGMRGDEQADITVHGGRDKAIYAYPSEHYPKWGRILGDLAECGSFGENLTTAGLVEGEVRIGDRFRIGTGILTVTQPRLPCVKMAVRFGRADMPKLFLRSGRCGFYLRVDKSGFVEASDPGYLIGRDFSAPTVLEVFRMLTGLTRRPQHLVRALACRDLGEGARLDLERLLAPRSIGGSPLPTDQRQEIT